MTAQILRIRDYEPLRRARTGWFVVPAEIIFMPVVRVDRPRMDRLWPSPIEEVDQVPSCWPTPGSYA